MVMRNSRRSVRQCGALMMELLAAMALLTSVLLPLAYSMGSERRLARSLYQRAAAVEIVDGEMEVLAAGAWRAFPSGRRDYTVRAGAATNLPPGRFLLTIQIGQPTLGAPASLPAKLRLEWRPAVKQHGGPVVREVVVQ